MLNSNMQCSHHDNGGSSEALHSAENVCFVCESMHLCVFAKVRHSISSAEGEGVQVLFFLERPRLTVSLFLVFLLETEGSSYCLI